MYSQEQEAQYSKLVDIIFERKYEIRIKVIDNTSIEEMQHFGRYTTGDKAFDKALLEERITRWLSINEMLEYYKRGKPFSIVNIQNAEEIYTTIHQYLLSWESRIKNSVNIGNAPIDDLIDLDSFAGKIHGYACETMRVQKTQSSLMNYFASVGLGRGSVYTPEEATNNEPKKHHSLAEIFSEAIMGRRSV